MYLCAAIFLRGGGAICLEWHGYTRTYVVSVICSNTQPDMSLFLQYDVIHVSLALLTLLAIMWSYLELVLPHKSLLLDHLCALAVISLRMYG